MAYMITHFFEGGTEEQYEAVRTAAHPPEGLPPGQLYHAAGPTEGGWLIVAVWTDKATFDSFVGGKLVPALQGVEGVFDGPPQERTAEIFNLETA
jgi:hypothetical protein